MGRATKVPAAVPESKLSDLPADLMDESKKTPSPMNELIELLEMLRTFDALDMKLVFKKRHYKVQLDIDVMEYDINMTLREMLIDENGLPLIDENGERLSAKYTLDFMHHLNEIPVKNWRFHDDEYTEHYPFLVIFMELLRIGSTKLKCIVDFDIVRLPWSDDDDELTEEEKELREDALDRAESLRERLLAWIKSNVGPSKAIRQVMKDNKLHMVKYLKDFGIVEVETKKTKKTKKQTTK